MKLFAGNIFFKNILPDTLPELDIDILKISKNGIYIMGGFEEGQDVKDVLGLFQKILGDYDLIDISYEEDDAIEILTEELESGIYECVSFEGPELVFEDIGERFSEVDAVICVREAEISKRYHNRVIRVDFLY